MVSEQELQAAIEAAVQVQSNAHCPYSGYQVGCAIVTAAGETFTGCNVENASYGLSICAERGAISKLVSRTKDREIKFVVVATRDGGSPCGACRQVLAEFATKSDFPVYAFANNATNLQSWTARQLLPDAFSLDECR